MPVKSRRQRQASRITNKRKRTHRRRLQGGENVATAPPSVFPYLRFPDLSFAGLSVLVTGGAGFIGSNIVDALLAAGAAKVRVLDNLETGKLENLATARAVGSGSNTPGRFEFMEGDITDAATCAAACAGMDIVYHEAALVSVPISMDDPMKNHDVNITGTLNMLIAAAAAGVSRFVYASSAATYGALLELPKREEQTRNYPSPYALSKGVDEDYATLWAANAKLGKGMTCVGLRYFNVYGPRQDPKSPYSGVISIFADKIRAGQPMSFFGKGEQTRDFVFVSDIVQANLRAGLHDFAGTGHTSRVYNVGTGETITLLEMKGLMEKIVHKEVPHEFKNYRPGNIMHSQSSIDRICDELGYEPRFTLEEGLRYLLAAE